MPVAAHCKLAAGVHAGGVWRSRRPAIRKQTGANRYAQACCCNGHAARDAHAVPYADGNANHYAPANQHQHTGCAAALHR